MTTVTMMLMKMKEKKEVRIITIDGVLRQVIIWHELTSPSLLLLLQQQIILLLAAVVVVVIISAIMLFLPMLLLVMMVFPIIGSIHQFINFLTCTNQPTNQVWGLPYLTAHKNSGSCNSIIASVCEIDMQ